MVDGQKRPTARHDDLVGGSREQDNTSSAESARTSGSGHRPNWPDSHLGDFEVGHHAHVFVFGVVAVEQISTSVAVKTGDDLRGFAGP